jgi:hypothetical protein
MKKPCLLLVILFIIVGCSKTDNLLGKWVAEDGTTTCEFFEKNKYSFSAKDGFFNTTSVGVYKIKNDSLFLYDDKLNPNENGKPYFSTKLTILNDRRLTQVQLVEKPTIILLTGQK